MVISYSVASLHADVSCTYNSSRYVHYNGAQKKAMHWHCNEEMPYCGLTTQAEYIRVNAHMTILSEKKLAPKIASFVEVK